MSGQKLVRAWVEGTQLVVIRLIYEDHDKANGHA